MPTRKSVEKAFKKQLILLNGEPVETGRFVKSGDTIALLESPPIARKVFHLALEVVFEDAHLAAVNKPAGYPVSGNRFKTIAQALPTNIALSTEPDALSAPLPVHRLDAATSGLLIVAKTRTAHAKLGQLFECRDVRKTYTAVVHGHLPAEGETSASIEGATALTRFKLLAAVRSARYGWLSLVELRPLTGRTHQLRIHMAGLGHPILGDKLYGTDGQVLRGKGLFLAATALHCAHPAITGRTIDLSITTPAKFDTFLKREAARWARLGGAKRD